MRGLSLLFLLLAVVFVEGGATNRDGRRRRDRPPRLFSEGRRRREGGGEGGGEGRGGRHRRTPPLAPRVSVNGTGNAAAPRFGMLGMHFTLNPGQSDPGPFPSQVTHVRLWDSNCGWKDLNPAQGVYEWSNLEVQLGRAQGKFVTLVIGRTPLWAAKNQDGARSEAWAGGAGSNSVPRDLNDFETFITNLVQRFAGRIQAYEIWNEPQSATFLYPIQDSPVLAQMTAAAYRIIKRIDPRALVLSASVLPRPGSGGMQRAGHYLRALKRLGWPVDVFTVHIYPESGLGAKRWVQLLKITQRGFQMLRAPTKPLWVTETLFGLNGSAPSDMTTTVNEMYDEAKRLGVGNIYWYAWNRPDLGGSLIADGTPTWTAILASQ